MTHVHDKSTTYFPLWRSDLVGNGGPARAWHSSALPHGWWCPECGGESRRAVTNVEPLHEVDWSIRMLPDLSIKVLVVGALAGDEVKKFSAAVQAAERSAAASREAQERRALGQVGWRVTTSPSGVQVAWYWASLNWRRGVQLVGIRPQTERSCFICRDKIQPGHTCWRGSAPPARLNSIERAHELRFCARCVAKLPEESWETSEIKNPQVVRALGRKVPALRLLGGGPP